MHTQHTIIGTTIIATTTSNKSKRYGLADDPADVVKVLSPAKPTVLLSKLKIV